MNKPPQPVVCADVIAIYKEQYVFVKRKTTPQGLALVGGKQDLNETLTASAIREFYEETGLKLKIQAVLGTYASLDRDPRGHYVSTVFLGVASGKPKAEEGKIELVFLKKKEILFRLNEFVFDHGKIVNDYFTLKDHENKNAKKVLKKKTKNTNIKGTFKFNHKV